MRDTSRHAAEFTGTEFDHVAAEVDLHTSTPDEKHLILVLVMMPWENPAKLSQLHLLPIQFRNDLGPPVFVDEGEFFGE